MQLRSGRIARTAVGTMLMGSLFTLSVWLAAGLAQEPSITTAGMRQAEGLLIARCAVCHSTDLVVQQRLARPAWEATVAKMTKLGSNGTMPGIRPALMAVHAATSAKCR